MIARKVLIGAVLPSHANLSKLLCAAAPIILEIVRGKDKFLAADNDCNGR